MHTCKFIIILEWLEIWWLSEVNLLRCSRNFMMVSQSITQIAQPRSIDHLCTRLLLNVQYNVFSKKRSMPVSLIYVDISQRLLAISLPFNDCTWNEATMNWCVFYFFIFTYRLEQWRRERWHPTLNSLRRLTVERLIKDVVVLTDRSSVDVCELTVWVLKYSRSIITWS